MPRISKKQAAYNERAAKAAATRAANKAAAAKAAAKAEREAAAAAEREAAAYAAMSAGQKAAYTKAKAGTQYSAAAKAAETKRLAKAGMVPLTEESDLDRLIARLLAGKPAIATPPAPPAPRAGKPVMTAEALAAALVTALRAFN